MDEQMLYYGLSKLDEKLSNVEFFVFAEIMRWLITSGLANQSSPALTTPKCIIIKKISLLQPNELTP